MISIVMAAYNRAHTLPRAIASVLAQTHTDWELIVVDDGSTDATPGVLAGYDDARLRVVRHAVNRGVTAAKNTGFDNAQGEWITTVDSDDEIVPEALAVLLDTATRVLPGLDAVSSNCLDSVTGAFTGHGLDGDQFMTVSKSLELARGEHWGMFRRDLLGDRRFDPRIKGFESVLWYEIHENARWYYLDRGLRIYHREGNDQLTSRGTLRENHARAYAQYAAIFDYAPRYVEKLKRWSPAGFRRFNFNAAGQFVFAGDAIRFRSAYENLLACGAIADAWALRTAMSAAPLVRGSRDVVSYAWAAAERVRG